MLTLLTGMDDNKVFILGCLTVYLKVLFVYCTVQHLNRSGAGTLQGAL